MNSNDNENKVSSYIDSLNEERKPKEHGNEIESEDIEEILETIRLVRGLKQPSLPDHKYSESLTAKLNNHLFKEKATRRSGRRWLYGMSSAAAALALIVTLNIIGPFNKPNMIHAMEQAYNGVKAYHGVLEVIVTNAEGRDTMQSKIEVWADKQGHYYVKGLEGSQKDLITVNDGLKKWQIQTQEKEVDKFAAFPDPYRFTFEIGKEIENVKNAVSTKQIGDDTVAGRAASVMEVTPQGGSPYRLWIDKETKMPLQKQSSMENSLLYKVLYTKIDFNESVPKDLLTYSVPKGFKEINTNPELVVNNLEETKAVVGFTPKVPKNIPASYIQKSVAVFDNIKAVKINYISSDNKNNVSIMQQKATGEFKPASTSSLGKINNSTAEVQSPVIDETGVLQGVGAYVGETDISSVRWQQEGFEYAIVGNASLEEVTMFIKALTNGTVDLSANENSLNKPQVEAPVDRKAEEGDQKSVDAGHSPWKLDPVFVSQVFVSLKISPEGITGDYPIKYEDLKLVKSTEKDAVVELAGNKTPIRRVYLKRLIRQDNTGIWTVVGYDPVK